MGYIIFEKHPGDLLTIKDLDKRLVLIEIGKFKLSVIGLIKLTTQGSFKVKLELPKNKKSRDECIRILNEWLDRKEILDYNVTELSYL